MPEYAWMCLYKQDSDYASDPKYAKILNIAKFWMWQVFQYTNVHSVLNIPWQSSECILGSKYARNVNMAGFWICKSYTGFYICHNMAEDVLIGREYAWICLNLRLRQGPEYVSYNTAWGHSTSEWILIDMKSWKGSECSRIPSMPGFCICKCCTKL